MDYPEIVHMVNTDPVAQALLAAAEPMRLAYTGLDGHPRVVPIAYLWNGKAFVFATPTGAYKLRAITAHPEVAFTVDTAARATRARVAELGPPIGDYMPLIMQGRGTASVEYRQGIPQEHIDASRRLIGDDEKLAEWERIKRETTADMAVVSIVPTHLVVYDFVARFPPPYPPGGPTKVDG